MTIRIGNAPCSWGVEFANDPRNPTWQTVLKECTTAGSYMHFKDINPVVKARAVANRTNFYKACGEGIFCNLGKGGGDFRAVRQVLLDAGFAGWCTVEQDCDPTLDVRPVDDARANRKFLESIGF